MTEDENKAIEYLMLMKDRMEFNRLGYVYGADSIDIILNLIEKQQKALEDSVSKEVIREKIKEILKYKEIAENEIEEKIIIADSDSLNFGRKQAHGKDVEILKEILGE